MRNKRAMYDTGIYLIAMSDDGMSTERLKQAIKDIEALIFTRENLPF